MQAKRWFIDKDSKNRFVYHRIKKFIFYKKTKYQKVEIFDSFQYGRFVILDDKIQSAERDEFIYHEALVHPVMLTHPKPEIILILGGGEGATLREVIKYRTVKRIVMVDIDREFVEICKKFLKKWHMNSFKDERVSIVYEDAFRYLKNNELKADVIIADISDPAKKGPARQIYTKSFFSIVKNSLKEDGIFVTHATSIDEWNKNGISRKIVNSIRDIFPEISIYYEYIPSFGCLWAYVTGSKIYNPAKLSLIELKKRIHESGLNSLKFYNEETHIRLFTHSKNMKKYFFS